jgi:hypothetical protein
MHRSVCNVDSKRSYRSALFLLLACATSGSALAHHSYAMFEASGTSRVTGTVAKLEWQNPHAFVWVYVPSLKKAGTYDLWAFENGSPSVLQAHGWTKESLKPGEKVEVEYWRLRDGSIGGHCEKITLSDGRTLQCPSDLGRRR